MRDWSARERDLIEAEIKTELIKISNILIEHGFCDGDGICSMTVAPTYVNAFMHMLNENKEIVKNKNGDSKYYINFSLFRESINDDSENTAEPTDE